MNKTAIEYLDYTWNPTHGCDRISEGCSSCWAERMSKRLAGMGARGYLKEDPFKITFHPEKLDEPGKVKNPSMIGVSFMGDLFHPALEKNYGQQAYDKIFDVISSCKQHTFVLLTKRPEIMKEVMYNQGFSRRNTLKNLYLGVSVENQEQADKRIPILITTPAALHFVSVEPLLNDVDLTARIKGAMCACGNMSNGCPVCSYPGYLIGLDWVIAGKQTGPKAQYCDPNWIISLRGQCVRNNVPFFLKGEYDGIEPIQEFPKLGDSLD